MFDVENETSKEIKLNMRFIKLEGLSQIIVDNKLYLCGMDCIKNEKYNGSSFICIDPASEPAQISFLVYSKFPHHYPSLIDAYPYIVVIGGRKNLNCEMYHKERKTWYELPELPEERDKCNLIYDEKKNFLYLFGGCNTEENNVFSSILKLNLKKLQNKWETIVINQNISGYTQKILSCISKNDNGNVYVVGGRSSLNSISNKNDYHEVCDTIYEWDFSQKYLMILECRTKLSKTSTFSKIQHGIEFNGYHYMIDDDNLVHKISFKEGKNFVYGLENVNDTHS